jgi:hypothetical protein
LNFERLVTGKENRKRIIENFGISRLTLSRAFKPFFDYPLTASDIWSVLPLPTLESNWVYGVDGKWLKRKGVFFVHRNVTGKENIFWSSHKSESYEAINRDLKELTDLLERNGLSFPCGAISDWKGAIVSGVAIYFGNIPHQRCLTHTIRTLKMLLPKRSSYEAVLKLREMSRKLIKINNEKNLEKYFLKLNFWYEGYGYFLKEKTIKQGGSNSGKKWWYTHGNLRRAWNILTRNTEPFLKHLNNSLIPKSNNALEGTISQAVNKLIDHRGMKLEQQIAFLNWYFAFTRAKTKSDLKKLWDLWKKKNRRK